MKQVGGFSALVCRRIDSRAELEDGEEHTYCVHCRHLVAVDLSSPEAWGTDAMPMCQECVFTELRRVTREAAELNAQHDRVMRSYRRWVRGGKILYWSGAVLLSIFTVLNLQAGDYFWATANGAMAAFYIWRFIVIWSWKEPE